MSESILHLRSTPDMKSPVMIVGFAGWPDAGGVSSLSVTYLRDSLNANQIGYIDMSQFIDHTQHRPHVVIEDGILKMIGMPSFEIYWGLTAERDVILIRGYEPMSGWDRLVKAIFNLVEKSGVESMVSIGGLLDRIPHTRPVRISFLTTSKESYFKAISLGLRPSNYQGPASIHSYLMHECGKLGLQAISVWGHVPSYLNIPNPRVVAAVLEKIGAILDIKFNLDRLYVESTVFEGKVASLVEQDSELSRLVERLEKEYDDETRPPGYIV
ncbi:MAG: PAC2 family protein [Aigarchaeota archaeon]|nr:PAC2 family protein [Candidatus Calditenuaceae archaeon]